MRFVRALHGTIRVMQGPGTLGSYSWKWKWKSWSPSPEHAFEGPVCSIPTRDSSAIAPHAAIRKCPFVTIRGYGPNLAKEKLTWWS